MTPEKFVDLLVEINFQDAFNPYRDYCPVHDLENAPRLRREALLEILKAAASTEVDALWIGRDLGYRGGRRTGLALTDDVHIQDHAARWGVKVTRPTHGVAIAERTAAVIWEMLSHIKSPIFLWNVFPLHPHEVKHPFSNRSHNAEERDAGEQLLCSLIALLKPRRVVAIGNDAGRSADRCMKLQPIIRVRHPSYGGQTQFVKEIENLYEIQVIQGNLI